MEIAVVSMPSRADDSFLLTVMYPFDDYIVACQCPLGLMTHFYQRPGYPHLNKREGVNALSG